jgi:transaldolase
MTDSYFHWLIDNTQTSWWHDSADPQELTRALELGAVGVTTNPFLSGVSLRAKPDHWRPGVSAVQADVQGEARAEANMRVVLTETAARVRPIYEATEGLQGYVCAQVNPSKAGDRSAMLAQAKRYREWAPNIAVKLPGTAAGMDVLEELAAHGITTVSTVSFTVPQVVAAAERHRAGLARARAAGKPDARCFAVVMIGRLDDYLREVVQDRQAEISDSDIRQAGLAVVKRAYSIFRECEYEARLLVAALRGPHHMLGLAGADLVMSVHPDIQAQLLQPGVDRDPGIERPVPADVVERLQGLPEFVKAFEPNGLAPRDFMTYGVTQRTLCQFIESGWKVLETVRP